MEEALAAALFDYKSLRTNVIGSAHDTDAKRCKEVIIKHIERTAL